MQALHINGNDLTLEAVHEVAHQKRPVLLLPEAREAVDRARAVVDTLVANDKVSYAITTGVGKLSDVRIAGDQIRELQVNLIRSHSLAKASVSTTREVVSQVLMRSSAARSNQSSSKRKKRFPLSTARKPCLLSAP